MHTYSVRSRIRGRNRVLNSIYCGVVLVFTFDQFLFRKNVNILKCASLQIFALTFWFGCSSYENSRFLYPSEKEMQVRYLCRLPYFDATAPHQPWTKSTPDLLIVGQDKAIVYFNNDRSFVISKDSEVNLPPGKYNCSI